MELCINTLSPSVSSSVAAFNWKSGRAYNLCPRLPYHMPQGPEVPCWWHLDYMLPLHCPLCRKSVLGYSEGCSRLGSVLVRSVTQVPGRQQTLPWVGLLGSLLSLERKSPTTWTHLFFLLEEVVIQGVDLSHCNLSDWCNWAFILFILWLASHVQNLTAVLQRVSSKFPWKHTTNKEQLVLLRFPLLLLFE